VGKRDSSNREWVTFKPGYPKAFDPFKGAEDFYLDEGVGQECIDFFEQCLVHVKGELALKPLVLETWEKAILGHLVGWRSKSTDLRRYKELFCFLPRKQGKSLIASGLSLYFLFCQEERGQEIYCVASDRSQARVVFDVAKMQVVKDEELKKRAEVRRSEIRYPQRDSVFRVLSSEASSKHGYNSNLVIFDELHAIEDRELVDVLITSTGARREPLVVSITTAGFDETSICYEKYDYAKKVRDHVIRDQAFLPVIYEAEPEAEWTSPETWKECNPNFGISISEEYLFRECERAKESPAFEAVFRRLHLNQWTEAESPYIRLEDWDRCAGPLPDLAGRKCYGGLDLSKSDDLTAFSLCFPPEGDEPFHLLSFGWIPSETAKAQRRRPYLQWINEGHLIKIPGAVIEYSFVIEKILQLKKQYDIVGVLFDRWGATAVYQALEAEGLVMIECGQGYKSMSPPTKELLRLILSQKIRHDNNPVLRWCVSNLTVETDAAGNVKPSKKKSIEKIDLAVSAIMALAGCLNPVEGERSVYDTIESAEAMKKLMWM